MYLCSSLFIPSTCYVDVFNNKSDCEIVKAVFEKEEDVKAFCVEKIK